MEYSTFRSLKDNNIDHTMIRVNINFWGPEDFVRFWRVLHKLNVQLINYNVELANLEYTQINMVREHAVGLDIYCWSVTRLIGDST